MQEGPDVPVLIVSGLERGRVPRHINACLVEYDNQDSSEFVAYFLVVYNDDPQMEAVTEEICQKYCPTLLLNYFIKLGLNGPVVSLNDRFPAIN